MKQSNQKVSFEINVTPDEAWKVIGAVNGVDKWLAPIEACRVEGEKRYCTADGNEFEENILSIDNEHRELRYSIPKQQMMPVENILGSMKVNSSPNNNAIVDWQWQFDVEEDNEKTAKEMLAGVGEMGIKGLESFIQSKITT